MPQNPFTYSAILGICHRFFRMQKGHKTVDVSSLDEISLRLEIHLSSVKHRYISPMYPRTALQIFNSSKLGSRFMVSIWLDQKFPQRSTEQLDNYWLQFQISGTYLFFFLIFLCFLKVSVPCNSSDVKGGVCDECMQILPQL